jgi:hypothetical protein
MKMTTTTDKINQTDGSEPKKSPESQKAMAIDNSIIIPMASRRQQN